MYNFLTKIKKGKWGGLFSLGIGTILSQGINLLIQPVLTRLISPEELGLYSYAYSLANLFIPIASLKLYLLIVTTEKDEEANDIIGISLTSVLLTSLLYIVLLLISTLFKTYGSNELILLFFLNPIIIFIYGSYYVFLSEDNRYKKYDDMAKAEVKMVGTMGLLQILSGILNFGSLGLLISRVFSPNHYFSRAITHLKNNYRRLNLKMFFINIRKYKNHIIYSVPSQFINSFSYTLIMFSILSLFSSEEVGYYSVSVRVLGIPLVLISNNLSKVYLQKISDVNRLNHSLYSIFKLMTVRLVASSAILFMLIAIIAPLVTEFIFGSGYAESGRYIAILCIMFSFRFVALSLIGTYVVINKQYLEMFFQILLIGTGMLTFFLTNLYNLNIYSYLSLISILYSFVYFFMIVNIGMQCKKNDRKKDRYVL